MKREKERNCGDEGNTRAIVACLAEEDEMATANYRAYVGAIRSLLGIMGAEEDELPAHTGQPLTSEELVRNFDTAESAWQKYREAQGKAAYDQFKGGTASGPEAGFCELMMVRNHMRELERIYYVRLHN